MFHRTLNPLTTNSFFLFGARGVGKTSLLRELFDAERTVWIDLLIDQEERRYAEAPDRLSQLLAGRKSATDWIVIDEVQKVPRLLDVVHRELELPATDGKPPVKFALTGSSARKLRRGSANLLAGRAFVYQLYPLTHVELGEEFQLVDVLRWGSLPKVFSYVSHEEKELFLDAYVQTYLKEEVVAEQLVRNLVPFRRFLEIAAQSNGTILNIAALARDLAVDDKTVKSYFDILEDTLLGFYLPAYDRSVRKQQLKAPKFYLFDGGVKRALEGTVGHRELTSQQFGAAFEHFIITELVRLNSYHRARYSFSYLATKGGLEIDVVVTRPGSPPAYIEVKSAEVVRDDHLRHLALLRRDERDAEYFCFCRETTPRAVDGVKVVPWRQGFQELGLGGPNAVGA